MIYDIIGYIGMVSLLIGMALNRKKGYALWSDVTLIGGQVGLVINCLYYGAIPVVLVNTILVILGFLNIRKDLKERAFYEAERERMIQKSKEVVGE